MERTETTRPLTVNVEEAGRLLSLSPFTIRLYLKTGRLKGVRFGRRIAVPLSQIQELALNGAPSRGVLRTA